MYQIIFVVTLHNFRYFLQMFRQFIRRLYNEYFVKICRTGVEILFFPVSFTEYLDGNNTFAIK